MNTIKQKTVFYQFPKSEDDSLLTIDENDFLLTIETIDAIDGSLTIETEYAISK